MQAPRLLLGIAFVGLERSVELVWLPIITDPLALKALR
jgi:hypothetical protein